MSTVINEVVKGHCKAVTENMFRVVGPLVETIKTSNAKPKVYP